MKNIKNWLKNTLLYPEKSPLNPAWFFLTFFAAINLGGFLEIFAGEHQVPFKLLSLTDYLFLPQSASILVWYVRSISLWSTVILAVIIILCLALSETVERMSRFVASLAWLLILPPVINLILSGGKGFHLHHTGAQNSLWRLFLAIGNAPGEIMALAIFLFCLTAYLRLKNCPLRKVILADTVVVLFIGALFMLPLLMKWLFAISRLTFVPLTIPMLLTRFFFILIWLETIALLYLTDKRFASSLLKASAWEKLLPLLLIFILGIVIYRHAFFVYVWENFLSFTLAAIVMLNGWLITRFLKASAADNTPAHLYSVGAICAFTALCALAINFIVFYLFTVLMSLTWIVWRKPWQIAHIAVLQRLVNAFQAFMLFCAGWHFSGGDVFAMPKIFILSFLLLPALFLNFLDLTKAAAKGNIVLFLGLEPAKTFCALSFFAAIASLPFILLDTWLLLPLLPVAVLGAYLCLGKNTNTRHLCHLCSAVLLITIVWLSTF